MKRIGSLLRLDFVPSSVDAALLVLRLWLGLSLLVLHGWSKLSTFQQMAGRFPDPLGLGSRTSLGLAVFGEVVCAILLILGFFTRFGALGAAVTMFVAFFIVHEGSLKPGAGSGELAFIYLAGFVAIFLAGPGKFALEGKGSSGARKAKPARD